MTVYLKIGSPPMRIEKITPFGIVCSWAVDTWRRTCSFPRSALVRENGKPL